MLLINKVAVQLTRPGTRAFGRLRPRPQDAKFLSGAERGAIERIIEEEKHRALDKKERPAPVAPPPGALLIRPHNGPPASAGTNLPTQIYPAHPHNHTPLRPVPPGFSALDRVVRDKAWESRWDLLERRVEPWYAGEGRGVPRRDFQDGVMGGIRVRPVQNPYVKLKPKQKYRLNAWPSKNWGIWDPCRCWVRGSRRRYRIPDDIVPYKDELGEWHPPRLSGRYKADVEKQYWMNSLPWVWSPDFYEGKLHFMDREPRGPKRWYKREFRRAQIAAALRRADQMVDEYRKERRQAKRLSWIERIVKEFAGDQATAPYVREQRLPRM